MVLVLAVAAGCANQDDKNTISALSSQNKMLVARNDDLQRQLDNSMRENNDLHNQLAASEEDLRNARATPPPPPPPMPGSGPTQTASGWERGVGGDRVTLSTDILFAPGSATLSAAGERALVKIANDLKKEYSGMRVRVYGYTDSDPIVKTKNQWKDNLDLSLNRSAAVSRFLTSKGVSKDRIETIGMGDTHFVASNANNANKAKNRRVEIVVMRTR